MLRRSIDPSRRRVAAAIASSILALVLWMAIEPSPARSAGTAHAASREVAELVAQDAGKLAGRIRADARRGGSPAMTTSKVVYGCCGVVALEVYERARAGSFARYGVYYMELVTQHGAIEKVSISELTTKRGYRFGEAYEETPYSIDMGPGSGGYWVIGLGHPSHPDSHWTTAKVQYHGNEAELTPAELQAIYSQAVGVLAKAEAHDPLSEAAYLHPGLPCGLPEHQACEPGGTW